MSALVKRVNGLLLRYSTVILHESPIEVAETHLGRKDWTSLTVRGLSHFMITAVLSGSTSIVSCHNEIKVFSQFHVRLARI
jgi:hypothetical protein